MSSAGVPADSLQYGVDYFGFLETVLRDLKGYRTLAHELVQNADDANGTSSLSFDVRDKALIVENNGTFADCGHVEEPECRWLSDPTKGRSCDFHRFRQIASGGKRLEKGVIGAFGIGFISVYQITDRPELISAGRHWIVEAEHQRIDQCRGCRRCEPSRSQGTKFILPWAQNRSSLLRKRLRVEPVTAKAPRRLLDELKATIPLAMIFLNRLHRIVIRKDGRHVKTFESEVQAANDCLIVSDGIESAIWYRFRGSFDDVATQLRAEHVGRIEEKRSSSVTIAIPEQPIEDGVFCAFLPTQHKTGLPFHINADFYPTSNRKEIVLEADYQSAWNRAAVEAAATALAGNLVTVRDSVGHLQLWNIITAAEKVSREAERARADTSLSQFWVRLEASMRQLPIVYTTTGKWIKADTAFFLEQKEEAHSIKILEALDCPIVHEDLRGAQNILTSKAVGVPIFSALNLAKALQRAGVVQRKERKELPSYLSSSSAMSVMWREIELLLKQYEPGRRRAKEDRDEIVAELGKCAIAPARDGAFWPCQEVYQADEESVELFSRICPSLPFLAKLDKSASGAVLQKLCPEFNASAAIIELAELDADYLNEAGEKGDFDSSKLLLWFADRRAELRDAPQLIGALRELPIYPSSAGPRPLTELSLPGNFIDPLGFADVVQLDVLGGRREFLRDNLGAKELTFETYATDHIPRAFADESVSREKRRKAVQLLASKLGELEGDRDVEDALGDAPVIECEDGVFRCADEVYFATKVVADVLENTVPLAYVPTEHAESVRSFYRWLGVADRPRLADAVARIKSLASGPPNNETARAIRVLFEHLGSRIADKGSEIALDSLRRLRWLPARDKRDRWYQSNELFADFNRYLFESEATFLDVSQQVQRNTDLLHFFGIHTAPEVRHVVGHILHCSQSGIPVHKEVYPWLENQVSDPAIARLIGRRCLYLPTHQRWVSPKEVFWQDVSLGKFRFQLGDEFRKFNDLLTRLGVRDAPGFADAIEVIEEISKRFGEGNRILDEETKSVLLRCWEMLERALDAGEMSDGALKGMANKKVICNAANVLNPPEWIFFDDRAGLAAKIEGISHNAIEKPLGAWRAMAAAGVRSLSEAVESHLIERLNPKDDESVVGIAHDRSDQLERVLDFLPGRTGNNLGALDGLRCIEVERLEIQYTLRLFGRPLRSAKETVPAHYMRDDHAIYFVRRDGQPPWPAVARELATILCPGVEPGQLASPINNVLSASSHSAAEVMLDELGYPRLAAASPPDAAASSSVIQELGDDYVVEEFTREENEPGSQDDAATKGGPATVEEAVAGILGPGAGEPTPPPSELNQPEHTGGGIGGHPESDGSGNGGSRGSGGAENGNAPGGGGKRKPHETKSKRKGGSRLRSYVVPDSDESRAIDEDGHAKRSAVDDAAIRRVKAHEETSQRNAKVMPHKNKGYDIESSNGDGTIERYIEVKGLSGDWGDYNAALTEAQFEKATELQDSYWLYVVERAERDDFQIHRIQNPANKVNQFLFDSGWEAVTEKDASEDGSEDRIDGAQPL